MSICKKIDKHPVIWGLGLMALIALQQWIVEGLSMWIMSLL